MQTGIYPAVCVYTFFRYSVGVRAEPKLCDCSAFLIGAKTAEQLTAITKRLNEELLAKAKELMGEEMDIPLGVSVGGVIVPQQGDDYDMLLKMADKALYTVKKNGKHGFRR